MKSISPIIASILIIVMTVAIAGLFYAFTSGMFNSIISSSNNLVNQQSKIISFTINSVYCSNNILYFDIYNKGNIPININNSQIIFTDNNGNTISINGSNIICNNGNIIPIGSNSLCYIINAFCYYNYTDYIKSTNFIYNGISYNYEILNNNKFNIIIYNLSNYPITLYNSQSIPTPEPFQQDIAICNGTINIGNNFAYINNATLFNQINPNGQNVMFFNPNNGQLFYSWYEGQVVNGNTYCDVWWINLQNGIPANSNVTIYIYVGNSSSNYYSHYYPYVGVSPQVISGYDNGQDVFIAYGYFNNTFDGWTGYVYAGSFSPTATSNGIEMINNQGGEGTYILPPNNGNIPKIPLIVEEVWYYTGGADANTISLFGNTNSQVDVTSVGGTDGGGTPASNLSTFVQYEYYSLQPYVMLKSSVTDQYLSYTSFPTSGGTVYSYLIVNSSYAQTGYYIYNSNQVWAPLTLLDTYNVNNNGYTYSNLNYNPFQYGTLEIGAGTGGSASYQYIQWVVARAYPPNGIMPSIYIG
jgi:flagellin-like protein